MNSALLIIFIVAPQLLGTLLHALARCRVAVIVAAELALEALEEGGDFLFVVQVFGVESHDDGLAVVTE